MAAITLKGISAAGFPGAGLDLKIADREFVVLTGPDRSSLSALVRAIAGLDALNGGEIFLDERRLNEVRPNERDVAYVAHDFVPYPRLSVHENISLGLELRKFGRAEADKRIQEAVELLELKTFLKSKSDELSSEQRRQVALARAIVHQPRVYIFNEPFAGLSPDAKRRGRAEIAKLKDRSTATIVYATSDGVEALALGGRIIFLKGGAIHQDGEARMLFESPATVAVAEFLGDPPMNLIKGTIKTERDGPVFSETGEGTITLRLPATTFGDVNAIAGKPVILGIRPDALEVAKTSSAKGTAFRALVERVELSSMETELYIRTGAHDLICRSRSWSDPEEGGRRAEFAVDLAKVHLFDASTGFRITAQT
jgi:multiple sugar transport system ATP-binding protein